MRCYGSGVTDGSITSAIGGSWRDASITLQTAAGISYVAGDYTAGYPNTATVSIDHKRFRTSGFKSLYSFDVTCNTVLTSSAVFYFDFHMSLSAYLDSEGVVECYIRTASVIDDSAAQYTYCAFVDPWRLMVWNNLATINANAHTYIDIFNVDLPLPGNVASSQRIGLTIDDDGKYSNGVIAFAEVIDTTPLTNSASDLHILTTTTTNGYILDTQTLTWTIDTLVTSIFTSGNSLYLLFPSSYAKWIARAQVITTTDCTFTVTGSNSNLATACTFLSQRILKIDVSSSTNQLYTLTLANIKTPPSIPNGKFNQYRFKMFVSDGSQNAVSYYSFTDFSPHLTLTANPSLVSLSWTSYTLAVSDSFLTLTPATANEVITVQRGYYSKVVELRQSIYPSNFRTSMTLTLSNYPTNSFHAITTTLSVILGKPTAYFRLAAEAATTTGLYIL